MPEARLPSSVKGWLVAVLAALVGLVAGFVTITVLQRVI